MWVKYTKEELKTSLARAEIQAYEITEIAGENFDDIIQKECDKWSDLWRRRISQFHDIDDREGFIPSEILPYINAQARYCILTRLPNAGAITLDDLRVRDKERADDMLDNGIKNLRLSPVDEEHKQSGGPEPCVIENDRTWRFE